MGIWLGTPTLQNMRTNAPCSPPQTHPLPRRNARVGKIKGFKKPGILCDVFFMWSHCPKAFTTWSGRVLRTSIKPPPPTPPRHWARVTPPILENAKRLGAARWGPSGLCFCAGDHARKGGSQPGPWLANLPGESGQRKLLAGLASLQSRFNLFRGQKNGLMCGLKNWG